MSKTKKVILSCAGVIGVLLAGTGTWVALNWDAVSRDFGSAVEAQTEKTKVTLFRWGEVMSVSAELEREYGVQPEVTYETDTGVRVLTISFNDFPPPKDVAAATHAREIAAFAVSKTNRSEEIDTVELRLQASGESFSFALAELI